MILHSQTTQTDTCIADANPERYHPHDGTHLSREDHMTSGEKEVSMATSQA